MNNKFILFLVLLLVTITGSVKSQSITIHTIGDSTMEEKPDDLTANPNNQRGWAQMLSQFVINDALVNNRSKSGTSSMTFYEQEDSNGNKRFWATVKPQIKSGDYVFIQFGHNDEKHGGEEGEIGTNPWQSYTLYLTKYVNEVRELGATPILFTPIVRNQFSNGKITDKGAHNLGEGTDGKALDYPAAMKKVAEDLNCLLVDHTSITKTICEEYGPAKVTELIYNVGDGTHLGEYGATLYARLAVQDLIRQNILTSYLNANPDLMINPKNHDFGKCYPNTSSVAPFSISGVDLNPVEGFVNITAPEGFTVSENTDGTFTQSINVAYSNSNLPLTRFYVKYAPETSGISQGEIELKYGSNSKTISVKGECVSFEDGQKATAYWELSQNESFTSDGPITVLPETFSKMYANRYASPGDGTVWENDLVVTGTKTQRCIIEGDNWPAGEIDIVHDRYIQFGVTATEGTVFNVDSIGLYIGAAGGSGIRYRVYYSKDLKFSDAVMIADRQNNANKTMSQISHEKLIEVKGGESLYLRVYPWYNGASASKAICLYGVTIKGVVTKGSELSIESEKTTKKTDVFCSPTVTSGLTTLNYALDSMSSVNISISSLTGVNVLTLRKGPQTAGDYQEMVDLTRLPAGMYLCSVSSDSENRTTPIIKK